MTRQITLTLIAVCIVSLALTVNRKQPKEQKKSSSLNGFAVVELFTSEGCSSCPPADELIAKIEEESKFSPVYILAYHVDYWDRLGWKDTFSDAKFSARQKKYADWLNLQGVYTPQIVVNGSQEFIGSDEATLRKAISTSLSVPITNNLKLSIEKENDKGLILNYNTGESTGGYSLVVSVISPNAINKILKGENKGKTLSHVQIVKQFETIDLNGKTSGTFNFVPPKINGAIEVIAFLQNNATGKIIGAARLNNKISRS